jgi:hypothetical protein
MEQRIAWAVLTIPEFKEGYEREGVKVDWEEIRRVAWGGEVGNDGKRRKESRQSTRAKEEIERRSNTRGVSGGGGGGGDGGGWMRRLAKL